MVKNIKLKKISKNKKILIYYTAIKLNKVLEFSKIISLLKKIGVILMKLAK